MPEGHGEVNDTAYPNAQVPVFMGFGWEVTARAG